MSYTCTGWGRLVAADLKLKMKICPHIDDHEIELVDSHNRNVTKVQMQQYIDDQYNNRLSLVHEAQGQVDHPGRMLHLPKPGTSR